MLCLYRPNILLTAVLAGAWILSLILGFRSLFSYESTPGKAGVTPPTWPAESKIARAPDRPTLVMLAHPNCPCTRASVEELAKIMAQTNGKLAAYVLLLKPEETDDDWDETTLRKDAAAIPGVTVLTDIGGVEAQRFGAKTSGHILLFDPAGNRLFSGGITGSRGHAGDNAGEDAIVSLVRKGTADRSSTFIFGCALNRQTEISR